MKYEGTILRVQRGGGGSVTLIVETAMGLRGIELDDEIWRAVVSDFRLGQVDDMIGWQVEYDPAHGDLDIIGPAEEDEPDEYNEEGTDDHGDETSV